MSAAEKSIYSNGFLIQNLNSLIKRSGMSETSIAQQINVPQATLNKVLSGYTANPKIYIIAKLAEYFNVAIDDLYSDNSKSKFCPLVTWEECSDLKKLDINNLFSNEKYISIDFKNEGDIFAVKTGESLKERFPVDSILIFNTSLEYVDGDYVIVTSEGSNSCSLRKVFIDGSDKLLLPFNRNSKNLFLDDNVKIVGTIIQSKYNYK